MSASAPPALTRLGSVKLFASTPAASISASLKKEIDSTPSRKLRQNWSTFRAPGKRQAIPITAISKPFKSICVLSLAPFVALSGELCGLLEFQLLQTRLSCLELFSLRAEQR